MSKPELMRRDAVELKRLREQNERLKAAHTEAAYERDEARKAAKAAGAVGPWMWQGDGDDHLESMGDEMAVRITAGHLRNFVETQHDEANRILSEGGVHQPAYEALPERIRWLVLDRDAKQEGYSRIIAERDGEKHSHAKTMASRLEMRTELGKIRTELGRAKEAARDMLAQCRRFDDERDTIRGVLEPFATKHPGERWTLIRADGHEDHPAVNAARAAYERTK